MPPPGSIHRALIVNADDFGQSAGINRGVVEAHECGIVTSASMMVMWPAAAEAAAYARSRPAMSVGLHVDLAEWIYRDGAWQKLYERVNASDAHAVETEVRAQLERFRDLLGCDPTHLDSHQHVHLKEPVRSIVTRLADEIGVPLRHVASGIQHRGNFYGQSAEGEPLPNLISVASLVASLRDVPPGVTELACHPGYVDGLESMYGVERTIELHTLCADEARHALADEQIRLISFRDLQNA